MLLSGSALFVIEDQQQRQQSAYEWENISHSSTGGRVCCRIYPEQARGDCGAVFVIVLDSSSFISPPCSYLAADRFRFQSGEFEQRPGQTDETKDSFRVKRDEDSGGMEEEIAATAAASASSECFFD